MILKFWNGGYILENKELKVGMYVRTDDGTIGKIYEQIGDMFTYKNNNRDYITYDLLHNEIVKASFNLIDLIEVGDYVNGCKITCISDIEEPRYLNRLLFSEIDGGEDDIGMQVFDSKNIKSVVTKEQFKSMKYIVERDD